MRAGGSKLTGVPEKPQLTELIRIPQDRLTMSQSQHFVLATHDQTFGIAARQSRGVNFRRGEKISGDGADQARLSTVTWATANGSAAY
jgi:hypothetical protein